MKMDVKMSCGHTIHTNVPAGWQDGADRPYPDILLKMQQAFCADCRTPIPREAIVDAVAATLPKTPEDHAAVVWAIDRLLNKQLPLPVRRWRSTPSASGGFWNGRDIDPNQIAMLLPHSVWHGNRMYGIAQELRYSEPKALAYYIGIERCGWWRGDKLMDLLKEEAIKDEGT